MTTVAISKLRENLPDFVDRVNKYMDRIAITVSGKPKAVLISQEELESMEETMEILSEPGAYKAIMRGHEEVKRGKGIPLEKINFDE